MKLSRPIVYTVVLGVAAYAAMLLTEPEQTPKKVAKRSSSSTSAGKDGFTEADLKAHFARYAGSRRDAFRPLVTPKRAAVARAETPLKQDVAGNWALTGITVIDGSRSAVIENGSTHDVAFLTEGQRWNGLTVKTVAQDSVLLTNVLNEPVRITFAAPPPEVPPAGAAPPGAAAPAGQVPLAPVSPPTNAPTRRGATSAANASMESVRVR